MEKKSIIANWKARKTTNEAREWLDSLKRADVLSITYPHTVILAAPFTLLQLLVSEIRQRNLPIVLASQDVSFLPQGSYTGEVPAELVKEFAEYVIVGHSERREQLKETDEMLTQKVEKAHAAGLKSIYCVQNQAQQIPADVAYVAYEPPSAIGSGNTAGLEDVLQVTGAIASSSQQQRTFLYGGSVDSENVKTFMDEPSLAGVLVGTKSVDASDFISLLQSAR